MSKTAIKPLRIFALLLFSLVLISCDDSEEQTVESLMERAIEQRDKGKLRSSVIDLKALLQKDPKNADARLLLGRIYIDAGDPESAEKELKIALDLGANKNKISFLAARARLMRGDYDGILEDYKIDSDQSAEIKSRYHLFRGEAYLARRKLDEADESFQAANTAYKKDIEEERPHLKATEFPEFVEAVVGTTNVAIARKNWDEAQSLLDRASAIAPDRYDVLSAKGDLAFKQQKFKESEAAFKAAFQQQPSNLQLQIGIARSQLMLKDADGAKENLRAVLKFFPDHVVTNYFLSLAELQKENYHDAKDIAEKILGVRPNYPQAHMVIGVASFGLGNFEQARSSLKRYVASAPTNVTANRLLGLSQLRLEQPEKALTTLKPLSDRFPEDVALLSLVASAAASTGDLVTANEYIEKASGLKPKDQRVRYNLAKIKLALGHEDEALQELERTIEETPDALREKYALMQIYLRSKEFEKALAISKELQKADPKNPIPSIGIGLAYNGLEAWPEAIEAFEQALEITPGHVGASYAIANVHMRNKDFGKLRAVYERVLEAKPKHTRTLMALVALAQREGRNDDVPGLIARAIEADPKAVTPRVLEAQNLLGRRQPVKAISALSEVANANPDHPGILQVLGRAQLDANKAGEAALTLERLVRLRPNLSAGHYLLAKAYGLLNNRGRMLSELNQTLALDPNFMPATIARIRGLAVDNKVELAKEYLSSAKESFPGNIDLMKLEAWVAMREGRPKDASKILADVSKRENSESLNIRLASARWAAEERESAVTELESWISKNPGKNQARLELANMYLLMNQREKARDLYIELTEEFPKNWVILNNLAGLLQDNDPEQALSYAERAVQIAPKVAPAILTLAGILSKQDRDHARIVKLTRPLARNFPDNIDIHTTLAKAFAKTGDKSRAVKLLSEFIARSKNENLRTKAEQTLQEIEG